MNSRITVLPCILIITVSLSFDYREIAAQSAKEDFNHSRVLLVSCLGWFFEVRVTFQFFFWLHVHFELTFPHFCVCIPQIPVIPVSFFFKSLTDPKQSIDEDLKSTYSDVKVSLVSSTKQSLNIDAFYPLCTMWPVKSSPHNPPCPENFSNAS